MKKVAYTLAATALILAGCKEKAPNIILVEPKPANDTSYVLASVPAADPHNVLFEDFTGATCTNCPAAHDVIEAFATANPGRANILALHIKDYPQTAPVEGHLYDFRNQVATDIQFGIYTALQGMPIGGVDRQGGGANAAAPLQLDPAVWSAKATSRLSIADSINLAVTSTFDSVAMKAKVTVRVTYLQPTSATLNVHLAVVEDSFVDKQEDNRVPFPYIVDNYHFNDILRDLITEIPKGDVIAKDVASKVAGFVYERRYTYDWNASWKPQNSRIVAFVTNSAAQGASNVYQSVQCKVKG